MSKEIYEGAILIAKQRCTMSNGQDALIIGKDYVVDYLGSKEFTVQSEIDKNHFFNLYDDGMGCWSDFFDLKTQTTATTTNIDFIPNHMTPTPHTRNLKIVATAFVVAILLGLLLFAIGKKQISEVQNAKNDSLVYYRAAFNLEKKQHGNDQAILLNDAEKERRLKLKYLHQLDSVKQRENKVVAHYQGVIANIVKIAPDSCKEYVQQVAEACQIMLAAKDTTSKYKDKALQQTQNELNDYYCLVESYQVENVTDSLLLDNSDKSNKAKDKEIAELKKTNRWQRWRDGLLGFVFGFGAGSAIPRD